MKTFLFVGVVSICMFVNAKLLLAETNESTVKGVQLLREYFIDKKIFYYAGVDDESHQPVILLAYRLHVKNEKFAFWVLNSSIGPFSEKEKFYQTSWLTSIEEPEVNLIPHVGLHQAVEIPLRDVQVKEQGCNGLLISFKSNGYEYILQLNPGIFSTTLIAWRNTLPEPTLDLSKKEADSKSYYDDDYSR